MIVTVIGARPQFIKAAVVSKALLNLGIKEEIIHTGQHYDENMSAIFWEELAIPSPAINLHIGSGSHGAQTATMIKDIETYILSHKDKIKALLLYGDTNSTLAGAIVGSKLKDLKVVHIEAGLRSFNKDMPEEVNRIMTDHVSDLLFCSSNLGCDQLRSEGIQAPVFNVGDVMYDAVNTFSPLARNNKGCQELLKQIPSLFSLLTMHRPSNTVSPEKVQSILSTLGEINTEFVWPVHPRVKNLLDDVKIPSNIQTISPASYLQMLALLDNCTKVFTDSGGLQKEAYWKRKQCITLREQTEWIETLQGGWNILVGNDTRLIKEANKTNPKTEWKPLYGDGNASEKIAHQLKKFLN